MTALEVPCVNPNHSGTVLLCDIKCANCEHTGGTLNVGGDSYRLPSTVCRDCTKYEQPTCTKCGSVGTALFQVEAIHD